MIRRGVICTALLVLAACGGGDEPAYGECVKPAGYDSAQLGPVYPPSNVVIYGTGAPWFIGPLKPAPADVSAAAGVSLVVCP